MELTRAAEDALFALFAVKLGVCSEKAIEKALARQPDHPQRSLRELLIAGKALDPGKAQRVQAALDPEVVAGFRIEAEAGRGGMGVVYRARQISMDRPVALKVLSRRLSKNQEFVVKFIDEARSAAKLNHEHVVSAIDSGESNGLHYFAMEFIDGNSVMDRLDEEGPLPWERTFEIVEQMARALEHAHAVGIVHRDVKPENIMIHADGAAKLCDLGLAKPKQEAGTGEKSGTTEGTPYYCSPEQALGMTDLDARTDVYSLGATAYHMLKGEPPFDADNARAIMLKHLRQPFPDLDAELPEVPAPYRRLLERMVVKERDQRLEDMRALEEGITAARHEVARLAREALLPPKPSKLLPIGAVLAVFCIFAGLGAGITMAVVDDDGEVVQTDPDGPPATPSDDEPPDGPDGGDDPEVTLSPLQIEARDAFAKAEAFRDAQPEAPWDAQAQFVAVAEKYPDTRFGRQAAREAEALQSVSEERGTAAFSALTERVLTLSEERRFQAALEEVETFRTTWKARGLSRLDARLETIARSVRQQAKALLERALRELKQASGSGVAVARAKLEVLLEGLPADVAGPARAELAKLDSRLAEGAWQELQAQVAAAVGKGDLDAAHRLLTAGLQDARLQAVRERVEQLEQDVDGVLRARTSLEEGCRQLLARDPLRLRLARGGLLEGRLLQLDSRTLKGELMPAGGAGVQPVDLRDLDPKELLKLVLPPDEGKANATLFVLLEAPLAAAAALNAAIAVGQPDDSALRARIQQLQGAALEKRALETITALTQADAEPEAVVEGARNFPDALRSTAAYRHAFAQIKQAFLRARGRQLATDEAGLFKGAFRRGRKDEVTISYEFESAAELEDFRKDEAVEGSRLLHEGDTLIVRGKVVHGVRFAGGDLEVTARVRVENPSRPNANIIISNGSGYRGILCGAGFAYGDLSDVKIDSSARKRAGFVIDLPAHALIILSGRAPRRKMKQVLAAEEKPTLKAGRSLKLVVDRNDRGQVKMKVGSRTVFSVSPVPNWEQPGEVAIAPFSSELRIEELEISGTLAEGALQQRAEQLAAQEANELPPPLN